MATARLRGAYATVTLDTNGNGTASIGPLTARETWHPENVHVSANTGNVTNEASCLVYVGDAVRANNFRDGTLSGSSGDTTDAINADEITNPDMVWAVWSGGDAGAIATLVVTGTKDI